MDDDARQFLWIAGYDGTLTVEVQTGIIGKDGRYTSTVAMLGGAWNTICQGKVGVLAGTGTVGLTDISGRVSPGTASNPIGTLTVRDGLVLRDGSFYDVDIAGDGRSDRIRMLNGGVQIGDGIGNGNGVKVTALDPATSYVNGKRYNILTAEGGVSGKFARAVTDSAFLKVGLEYKPKDVNLVIGVDKPVDPKHPVDPKPGVFDKVAISKNQVATARSLNTLDQKGESLALYNSLLILNAENARQAFDRLSGDVHASAVIEEGAVLRSTINDRLRSAEAAGASDQVMNFIETTGGKKTGSWARITGRNLSYDGNCNSAGFDGSGSGIFVGLDSSAGDWVIGDMVGFSRSTTKFDIRGA